jgi:hypothetical protein
MTEPPSCSEHGALQRRALRCIIARAAAKAPGIGTVSGANGGGTLVPSARMPGSANGSILSLVNRAVKSNIFMKE